MKRPVDSTPMVGHGGKGSSALSGCPNRQTMNRLRRAGSDETEHQKGGWICLGWTVQPHTRELLYLSPHLLRAREIARIFLQLRTKLRARINTHLSPRSVEKPVDTTYSAVSTARITCIMFSWMPFRRPNPHNPSGRDTFDSTVEWSALPPVSHWWCMGHGCCC